MAISARAYFLAGTLLALGSLTAGVVHCAQQGEGAPWRNLVSVSAPAGAERPAPQAVPAEARCPVCGMYPARFPAWAAQVHLRDGSIRFFDSPVEFFRWLRPAPLRPGRGGGRHRCRLRDRPCGRRLAGSR
jgi:hypothetical protein